MSARLAAMAAADVAKGKDPGKKAAYTLAVRDDKRWSGMVTPVESAVTEPLSWRTPKRVFVNSMSDLFWGDDEDLADARRRGVENPQPVPFEFIDKVFAVMALCPQHTFQVLTKRPKRMAEYLSSHRRLVSVCEAGHRIRPHAPTIFYHWPLGHVWLGTSVEDQKAADERIPHLLHCRAAVRFLSCEPLLGPVRLDQCAPHTLGGDTSNPAVVNAFSGTAHHPATVKFKPEGKATEYGIHWVVVGGESGNGARPMHPAWARSIRDQCAAAGVPYFFKQWGSWIPCNVRADGAREVTVLAHVDIPDEPRWHEWPDGSPAMAFIGKKAAGRLLDGEEHNDMPATAQAVPG